MMRKSPSDSQPYQSFKENRTLSAQQTKKSLDEAITGLTEHLETKGQTPKH
jgi:hypothetical protein